MKISTLLILVTFSLLATALSQPIDTLWTKTISYPGSNVQAINMIKYSSNEFIVTGGFGDSLYIVKVNSDGNIVWEKYLYEVGGLYGADIDKDSFGNFYVTVWNYNLSNQWQLIKFDASGDSLWSYTLSDPGSSFHIPYAITVNSDYVYVAASAGNGPEKYALHKFNLDGDLLYSRTYQTGSGFSIPRSITHDSQGNVILAGNGGSGDSWYILKCNSNGDTLWSKSLFEVGQEALSVLTDNEDNMIVTGWSNKIIKLDTNGNLIFNKTLGGNQYWQGSKLVKYDDNNILVVGTVRNAPLIVFDIILGKYSLANGDSVWTYVYDHPDNTFFGAYGLDGCVLFDTSLVVLSYTKDLISGLWYDNIYLMKFSLADTPVPVELESFTANVNGTDVTLNWTTATETNNQGFEIERTSSSATPVEVWENIGYVAGFGTTTETKSYSFTDGNISAGKYIYRLKQIDFDGTFEYSSEVMVKVSVPNEFALEQNFPNPFNPSTTIEFAIPQASYVNLKVYNILGQEVKTLISGFKDAGAHTINFDAKELNSGMYLYKLEAGSFTQVRKMLLLK